MSLCNIIDLHGNIPRTCLALRAYLTRLAIQVEGVNPVRCGSGASAPSQSDLTAAWSPCDVPPGGMVHWYDTVSGDGSQWLCLEGSVVGCTWVLIGES